MTPRITQLIARYVAMLAAMLLTYLGVEEAEGVAAEVGLLVATATVLFGGVIVDHWIHKYLDGKGP